MRIFLLGIVVGGLAAWGAFVTMNDDPPPSREPTGPEGPRESEAPPARSPAPPPLLPSGAAPRPGAHGETGESFAPGTAILRIGDWYTFGRDRASSEAGDLLCRDIRYGADLGCPHGAGPVGIPLGALGLPKKASELAALVVDAPGDLEDDGARVGSRVDPRNPGVALVRSASGRTYKVWFVREEHHVEALRRRVHLAWAEVPVKPGGGIARLATAKGLDEAGPTQKDIRRIIAAGRAIPGDSFASFLNGAYVRPDTWPEKLVLRERAYLLAENPLSTEVEFHAYSGLYAAGGIARTGKVTIRSYTGVAVRGAMEGVVDVRSYGYLHIAGDLTGEVNVNSYATVVIEGDLVGTLRVRSYTRLLLHGRIRGTLEAKSSGCTFYFDGYRSQAELVNLGDDFGQVTLHVKESDLPTGKHKKIGPWREVVVGDKAWKKMAK